MKTVLSYSVAFLWGKCWESFCWMPEPDSCEGFRVCLRMLKFWCVSWSSRGVVSLPIPSPHCPASVFSRLHASSWSRCLPILERCACCIRSWAFLLTSGRCWVGRPASGPRGCGSRGAESAESLLLFKRLVHWSSSNVELSLDCFLLRNLGTIRKSGRSIYSEVVFRETRLITEY